MQLAAPAGINAGGKGNVMKILHCADIHLDSSLRTNLDRDKAALRKNELLSAFSDMVKYAVSEDISAVIIAGDLFDNKNISANALNTVKDIIETNGDITFYFLSGNHDSDAFVRSFGDLPENLFIFSNEWTSYRTELSSGKYLNVTGIELDKTNSDTASSGLFLKTDEFNIVVMHGQLEEYGARDKAEVIDLRQYCAKNIDYLALGHIHEYRKGELGGRGVWCYPGCLEGRGYDECGEHGFVVLDIDEGTLEFETEFVSFAKRHIYELNVDISKCATTPEILREIDKATGEAGCFGEDMVKVVLTGSVDVDCEKNTAQIEQYLSAAYFASKVYDKSEIYVDYDDYAKEASLKGEFVRLIHDSNAILPEDKGLVIRCGVKALAGEEIEL